MNFYCVREILREGAEITGAHRWGLPGIRCNVCHQTWSNSGLEYPSIDLSDLPEEPLFRNPRAEGLEEFLRLKDVVRQAFPSIKKLSPGTSFGPFEGNIKGAFSGFIWNMPWRLMIEGRALKGLESKLLTLPTRVPTILNANGASPEVFEFEIRPHGKLLNGKYSGGDLRYCYACGRDSATMPPRLVVEYSSIPQHVDLFRLSNFTTLILATERLVEAVTDEGIEGAFFERIDFG